MAQMSMNKVIHAALRRDLDRFVAALERFAPGDRDRGQALGRAWDNFHHQLTRHHEGEHEIAWPALQQVGVPADLLAEMDAEHETMAAALGRADGAMTALRLSPGVEESTTALETMRELRSVTVTHLDHEERAIEPVYLEHADSAPIKEMGRKFSRESGPAEGGRFMAWLADGADPQTRAAMTTDIPRPVFVLLSAVFGLRYRRDVAPVWR